MLSHFAKQIFRLKNRTMLSGEHSQNKSLEEYGLKKKKEKKRKKERKKERNLIARKHCMEVSVESKPYRAVNRELARSNYSLAKQFLENQKAVIW